jgi:molybdenum cofactor cytidylyltransferase
MGQVSKPKKFNAAAIVLAAGTSSRYGEENKLTAIYKGVPLIDHTLKLISELPFKDRVLVTGHEREAIETLANDYPVRFAHNENFADGMGSSIATGIGKLNADCDAVMIFLADMPDIPPELVGSLIYQYAKTRSNVTIARPIFENQTGHPVLFSSVHFNKLAKLTGDQGASDIIKNNRSGLLYVRTQTQACVRDIDRPELLN